MPDMYTLMGYMCEFMRITYARMILVVDKILIRVSCMMPIIVSSRGNPNNSILLMARIASRPGE